ncbi:MAG: hypothetical protein CR975_01360 [Gammaproteobacteria bacterium]|nr:MAG: hypothetical protein CR975_01360 [Gammaproteobacteria bacterium]
MKFKQLRRKMQGFTLMELMIIITVLGIIAAIALPSYRRQVQTTNRKAAIAEMKVIEQRLERFYTTHNGTYTGANTDQVDVRGYAININIPAGGQSYQITAALAGDGMGDPSCGNLTMDSLGDHSSSVSGANKCFR